MYKIQKLDRNSFLLACVFPWNLCLIIVQYIIFVYIISAILFVKKKKKKFAYIYDIRFRYIHQKLDKNSFLAVFVSPRNCVALILHIFMS